MAARPSGESPGPVALDSADSSAVRAGARHVHGPWQRPWRHRPGATRARKCTASEQKTIRSATSEAPILFDMAGLAPAAPRKVASSRVTSLIERLDASCLFVGPPSTPAPVTRDRHRLRGAGAGRQPARGARGRAPARPLSDSAPRPGIVCPWSGEDRGRRDRVEHALLLVSSSWCTALCATPPSQTRAHRSARPRGAPRRLGHARPCA